MGIDQKGKNKLWFEALTGKKSETSIDEGVQVKFVA